MKILLVEDQSRIASFIQRGLKEAHYTVDVANDGVRGQFQAEVNEYDLIILDVLLPGKDGITVCQELRANNKDVPVLMLSAKDTPEDRVRGLNAGADDYLGKPFSFNEFLARIQALLRRKRQGGGGNILQAAGLELNQLTREVKQGGALVDLTAKEFALLEYLMLNADHPVTRTMISEHVWHEDFDSFTNVIDVYINRLRDKVSQDRKEPLIHTVRGRGYMVKNSI